MLRKLIGFSAVWSFFFHRDKRGESTGYSLYFNTFCFLKNRISVSTVLSIFGEYVGETKTWKEKRLSVSTSKGKNQFLFFLFFSIIEKLNQFSRSL